MKNAREIGWIARNEPQRTLAIERLETVEELTSDFQVRLHPEPYENQLVHFIWRSNGQRRWSHPGDSKSLRSLPNWQTADGSLLESLVAGDHPNRAGDIAAGLNQDELSCVSRLIRGYSTSDARGVVRQLQSRS